MIDFAKMRKLNEDIREVVKGFSDAAYENYGTYGYAAGYLESTLVQAMMNMTKAQREAILADLLKQTERQKQQKELDKTAA